MCPILRHDPPANREATVSSRSMRLVAPGGRRCGRHDLRRAAMRILIVKTSSLGDIVHGLTVVDDIHRAHRDAVIDWVAEEAFAELPALHPGIRRTLPVAVRRWRRSLWAAPTRVEMGRFDAMLRADRYDVVLDLQGLVKSALIASRVRALRCGFDWRSAREPSA